MSQHIIQQYNWLKKFLKPRRILQNTVKYMNKLHHYKKMYPNSTECKPSVDELENGVLALLKSIEKYIIGDKEDYE